MASAYTNNYNLDLYTGSDKPNLRDQYNAAMNKIDAALVADDAKFTQVDTSIISIGDLAQAAKSSADNAIEAVSGYDARFETIEGDIESMDAAYVALEHRVDTAESDIDGMSATLGTATGDIVDIKGDVEALGTATGELNNRMTAAETAIEDIQDEIEGGGGTIATVKDYIAFIGDSFSNGSNEVAALVASGLGLNLINHAANGAGFIAGTTFAQQLGDIVLDENFHKVKYVVVYGGVNDFNDAHATAAQMQTAFANFKSAWETIPVENRPQLVICFGNVGLSTQGIYDGFYIWYMDCMRRLKNLCMPGIVDNVCYWLMGYSGDSVFEDDNLHPNSTGLKIIASYIMSVLTGGYTGVHQEFTGSSSIGVHLHVGFDNGIVTASVKGSSVPLPTANGYTQIATVSSRQLCFGGDNTSPENQNFITSTPLGIYANSSGNTAQRQLVFNTRNGNLYTQCIGTVSLIPSGDVNLDTVLTGKTYA